MIRTKPPVKKRGKQKGVSTPFRWDDHYLDLIEWLVAKGHTQREIADALKVHKCTVEYWIRTKPKLREAIKRGEKEIVERVKRSYIELALGYEHPDTVVLTNHVTEYNEKGKPVRSYNEPLLVPIMKKYPPNAYACHKILTIKDRENWADIQKVENSININIQNNIDLSDFSDDELSALEKIGIKQLAQSAVGNTN